MDMSIYPYAVGMSAGEFMNWSTEKIEELMKATGVQKGLNKILGPVEAWAFKNSIHPLHFGLACCALEMAAASDSKFDLERLGTIYRSSPRQTDVLLVNGWVTKKVRPALRRLYEQMPDPKWVVAMGECAISGGPWYDSFNIIQGVDSFIPVDVYVPGCPARPDALIDGFMLLQQKISAEIGEKGLFLNARGRE